MKKFSLILITLLCVFALTNSAKAQCPSIDFATLKTLQDLPAVKKETKILEMGFKLKEGQNPGDNVKTYVKCWTEVVKASPI